MDREHSHSLALAASADLAGTGQTKAMCQVHYTDLPHGQQRVSDMNHRHFLPSLHEQEAVIKNQKWTLNPDTLS